MKQTLPLLYFFLSISLFSYAQERYHLGYLISNPVGDFMSTDLESGSFATPGWGIVLENKSSLDSWPENLYIGFHISYQENDLDHEAVGEAFTNELGNDFRVSVSGGDYNPFVITIGPYYDVFITDNLFVGLKSGIGVMLTNISPMVIEVDNNSGVEVLSEVFRSDGVPGFTFLLGTSLNLNLSESFGIGVFADYSSANEKVNGTFNNLPDISSDFSLAFINTGFNISFRIN